MPRLALIVTLASCADVGTTVRILDRAAADGSYTTRDVELSTLRDVDTVSGDVAQMRGGATVRADPALTPADRGASRAAYVAGDAAARASWIADGAVAVPTDFDTLTLFTAYAHLESAARHFLDLGVEAAADTLPVYYNPSVDKAEGVSFPERDNAAYFPEADAFLLLPPRVLQDVPLAMNPGVIAHEYAHRVLYDQLWGGEMFASLEEHREQPGSGNAWNRIRATDEGVADFFGAAVTGDPNFLGASTPADISEPRDLSTARFLDSAWVNGREPTDENGEYARYLPGAVVGSALWRLGEIASVEETERAVLAAEAELFAQVRGQFEYEFGDLESAVIRHLAVEHRAEACAALRPRYLVVWSRFASTCP